MHTPRSKLIDVTPEELDSVLERCRLDQSTHLAIVGPRYRVSQNIQSSPEWQGRTVYRIAKRTPSLVRGVRRLCHVQFLVLADLDLTHQDVAAIAENLQQLTYLTVNLNNIGEAGVRAIVENLRQLTSLKISNTNIGEAGARTIAQNLRQLASLEIRNDNIGEAGGRAIAENLRQLTFLKLSNNYIGEAGARIIAENLQQLTELNVSNNNIGEAGVRAIAENLRQLTFLEVSHNNIGEAGARTVAENLGLLAFLDVSNNNIGEAGVRAIAENLRLLTSLKVSNNNIGAAGARAISKYLRLLTELHVSNNNIGEAGMRAIAENLRQLTELNIDNNNIGEAGARAIAKNLRQLTSLNGRRNIFGSGGAREIAEKLLRLTSLEVSSNHIGEAGARAIAKNLRQLTLLQVSDNSIGEAGVRAIAEGLQQVTSLEVNNNNIGEAGARIIAENLRQLTFLDVSYNNIGEAGARAIAENLRQLAFLDVSNNNIGEAAVRAIAENLRQLTALKVSDNYIGEAGARAIAENLRQLTELHVSNNSIGDAGLRAIAESLRQLTELIVDNNNIGEAGARAIAENLQQLAFLSVNRNSVGDTGAVSVATGLERVVRFHIEDNDLGDDSIGAISRMPALRELSLSGNKRVHALEPLVNDSALRTVVLARTSVADLSPFASRIRAGWPVSWHRWTHEEGLGVEGCPLDTPPVEVARQGPDAVRNYFIERNRQDVALLHEAKVLIIGDGGVGKTSLVRRLYRRDLPLPLEDESTRGIAIHRQDFLGDDGVSFRLNVWDFGGQQIYHATHQFFLTKSSLYILVDDTRKSDKSIHHESFKFWFDVVETLSDKSPLLIFQNEKGGRTKAIDLAGIKGRFPNVLDVYAGDLERPDAVVGLRLAIQFQVQRLPHVGSEVPAKWVAIREAIEDEAALTPFITQERYFAIYRQHLPFDRKKALFLSRYLHDLGVFLHFQDDMLLRKAVILQNQWATDAVFRLLDDETIKRASGRFTLDDCARVWAEEKYADMQSELMGLMRKFELCYPLPDSEPERWLAPQLMTPSRPTALESWAQPSDLVVRFRYSFLPRGLVSRLMVRQHRFVKRLEWAWVHGAFFEHDKTQALVHETLQGSEIELRARGPDHKALVSVLVSDLDAINDTFQGLRDRVDKLVPCICSVCRATMEPQMYRHAELVERKAKNKSTIECRREPYEDVRVLELLDGIEVDRLPDWAKAQTVAASAGENKGLDLTIFLASSAELSKDRDAFELYFRQQNDRLRKHGIYLTVIRWENFLDAMAETRLQDEYNKRIRSCDIFVSLFRTKAAAFTGEEFSVALEQFQRTGKPRIYTYFKNAAVSSSKARRDDLESLWDFQDKLKSLGHFFTSYKSTEHLNRHFKDQLEMLLELQGQRSA